jgi:bifunctional non-homologous end joining protein LigD
VKDRPLVLKRYPDGVGGPLFYQQNAGTAVPKGVRVESVGSARRLVGGDLLTLLYTVQLGCIEVHPWLSRLPDSTSADRCLIDLDPGDDVPFPAVAALARDIVRIAEDCELPIAVKTSGSEGIHLVIPLPARTSFETSARLAKRIAEVAVMHAPDRATVQRSLRSRPKGTIYVDAMQNARGKSMACAYSVRPNEDAAVSAPLRVRELTARLRTTAFTVRTMPARVSRLGDLWGEELATRATARAVSRAISALEKSMEDASPAIQPRRKGVRGRAGGEGAGGAAAKGARGVRRK